MTLCWLQCHSFPDAQWFPDPSPVDDQAVGIGEGALQLGYQSPPPFWRSPNFYMTILIGFHGFQHISNPRGCAATWLSSPCLHAESTVKDLASTLSLKH